MLLAHSPSSTAHHQQQPNTPTTPRNTRVGHNPPASPRLLSAAQELWAANTATIDSDTLPSLAYRRRLDTKRERLPSTLASILRPSDARLTANDTRYPSLSPAAEPGSLPDSFGATPLAVFDENKDMAAASPTVSFFAPRPYAAPAASFDAKPLVDANDGAAAVPPPLRPSSRRATSESRVTFDLPERDSVRARTSEAAEYVPWPPLSRKSSRLSSDSRRSPLPEWPPPDNECSSREPSWRELVLSVRPSLRCSVGPTVDVVPVERSRSGPLDCLALAFASLASILPRAPRRSLMFARERTSPTAPDQHSRRARKPPRGDSLARWEQSTDDDFFHLYRGSSRSSAASAS